MSARLYYVHDPMCAWCYGFAPTLARLSCLLPGEVRMLRLLGGLAPDADAPMPEAMRRYLQQTWQSIQQRIPGAEFNFDFWTRCAPRRSTFPACRAVIAARRQDPAFDEAMTLAVQRAYYREARNPSDSDTLIALAGEIGANVARFRLDLNADATRQRLQQEISLARELGADSFPALVLESGGGRWSIPVDFSDTGPMLEYILDLC